MAGRISGLAAPLAQVATSRYRIDQANLDGTGRTTVVDSGNGTYGRPAQIAVDSANGTLYWTDEASETFWRANLDGSAIEALDASGRNVGNLIVAGERIIWTEPTTGDIMAATLDGTAETTLYSGRVLPLGLDLIDEPIEPVTYALGTRRLIGPPAPQGIRAPANSSAAAMLPPGYTAPATDAAVLNPADGATWTATGPRTVSGAAYAASGLRSVVVTANGATIHQQSWSAGIQDAIWTASWTPTADGSYAIVARVTARDGTTAQSRPITVVVDRAAPVIAIDTTAITGTVQLNALRADLTGRATDAAGVATVDVRWDGAPWQPALVAPCTTTVNCAAQTWVFPITFPGPPDGRTFTARVRVTDRAGRTSDQTRPITVDLVAPQAVTMTLAVRDANGATRAISEGMTIHQTAPALTLGWTASSDRAGLRVYRAGWSTSADPDAATLAAVLPTAPRRVSYQATDGQTLYAHVVVEDRNGNRTVQTLGPVYVDGPATPDLIGSLDQQAWTDGGTTLVGEDRELSRTAQAGAALTETQQLYTSWNADALRLQWRGANWNTDGDLFVYLDTTGGGATSAFDPFASNANVTLPSGMAADYVVWVRGSASAQLLRWTGSAWGEGRALGDNYRWDGTASPFRTDLLLPFAWLRITNPAATSLELLALASDEGRLRLWASVPDKNPLNSPLVLDPTATGRNLRALALTQALRFPSLGANVRPNAGRWTRGDLAVTLDAVPTGQAVGYLDSDLLDLLMPGQPLGTTVLPAGDTGTPLRAGDTVTYTLRFTNRGAGTVTGATVTLRAVGALQLTGNTQALTLGDIAPGTTGTRTVTARVTGAGTTGEIIATVADATHAPSDWLWVRHTIDRAAPTALTLTTPLPYVRPGINLLAGTVADDAGVRSVTVELTMRPGNTTRTLDCLQPARSGNTWSCPIDAGTLAGITSVSIRGRATDIYGNVGAWTGFGTFAVDTTPPAVALDATTEAALADGLIGPDELLLSGTVRDNRAARGADVCVTPLAARCDTTVSAANGPLVAWNYSLAALAAADGVTQTLSVRGTDDAGNPSAALTRTFRLDTVAPTITATQTITTAVRERYPRAGVGAPVLRGTIADGSGVASLYARVQAPDGTIVSLPLDVQGNRWSISPALAATGTHLISVEATDRAGNRAASATFELAVRSDPNQPTPSVEPSATGTTGPSATPTTTRTTGPSATPTTTRTTGPSATPTRTTEPTPIDDRVFLPLIRR